MSFNPPATDEWQRLYAAMAQVKALAPWAWMDEDDVFGVQNPETDELGFVSVMGALGEHLSVALYLGEDALYRFWAVHESGAAGPPEEFLETPQLQASFEDRNMLAARDRQVKKELGLKFRGRQAWPLFRSYRPGYAPWYIEAHEARFLTYALEQLADVAVRFDEDPDLLIPGEDDEYLTRVPRQEQDGLVWEDQIMRVSPPPPALLDVPMDLSALERLKQSPKRRMTLEVDFFWTPAQIQATRDDRPQFAYNLLVVDSQSGAILGTDVAGVKTSIDEMRAQVPVQFVTILANNNLVPRQVNVQSEQMHQLLAMVGKELGFKVRRVHWLPLLEQAKEFLFQQFMR